MNKRNNKPELIIREREDPFKKDLLDSISTLKEAIGLLTSEVQQLRASILMSGLDRISDKQKDTITQPIPSNPLSPYYPPTTPYPQLDPNYVWTSTAARSDNTSGKA
jgi:hypothetical protein